MPTPVVYRKTAKGQTEVETRVHRLGPRQRAVLIVVDGRRDSAQIAALIGAQAAEALAALAADGFIEAAEPAAVPAVVPAAAPPLAPAAPVAAVPFEQRRRDAVRVLTDLCGPAVEPLAIRMERARSDDELRPLIALAQQAVANLRGRQAAADYGLRFGG